MSNLKQLIFLGILSRLSLVSEPVFYVYLKFRFFSLDYLGFEKLLNIEDLWMNDCKIEDFKQIEALTHMKRLKTVYLERNPIYRDPMYRKKIMLTLPQGRFYRK